MLLSSTENEMFFQMDVHKNHNLLRLAGLNGPFYPFQPFRICDLLQKPHGILIHLASVFPALLYLALHVNAGISVWVFCLLAKEIL